MVWHNCWWTKGIFGIIIVIGLVVLPNFADHWKSDSIFSQPGIVEGMSWNRFEQLCGRLHFNDNRLARASMAKLWQFFY